MGLHKLSYIFKKLPLFLDGNGFFWNWNSIIIAIFLINSNRSAECVHNWMKSFSLSWEYDELWIKKGLTFLKTPISFHLSVLTCAKANSQYCIIIHCDHTFYIWNSLIVKGTHILNPFLLLMQSTSKKLDFLKKSQTINQDAWLNF